MHRRPTLLTGLVLLGLALLTACGGGEPAAPSPAERLDALLDEVNAARAEAVAQAASGPCSTDAQCSTLVLRSPLPPCFATTVLDFSRLSPTAAQAQAAAVRHAAAASAAEPLVPPMSGSCFTEVDLRPLACIAGHCQRGFVF